MKSLFVLFLAGVAFAARLENTYLPPGSALTAGGSGQFLSAPFAGQRPNGQPPSGQYGAPVIQARQPGFQQSTQQALRNFDGSSQKPLTPSPVNGPASLSGFNGAPQKSLIPSPVYGPASNGVSIHTNGPIPNSGAYFQKSPSPVYGPAGIRSNNPEARANTLRADNTNDGSGNYHFDYETENKISQSEQGQLKQVTDGEATVVQGSYSYAGDDGKLYTVNYVADENGFQPSGEHIDQAITMTASDAAKTASNEDQRGYNYNSQQNRYNGYQQGYSAPQQQGFSAQQQQVFGTHQPGVIAQQPGFTQPGSTQPGFNVQQQGFNGQKSYAQHPAVNGGYKY